MALWEKSMRLQGFLMEQMKSLYGPKFPIEVRHYLANWIESQTWSDIDSDNPEPHHEEKARVLYEGMLHALQDLVTTYSTNFITKTQLEALYTHMRNEYSRSSLELVRMVQTCLFSEAELVDRQEHLNAPSPMNTRVVTSNLLQIQHMVSSLNSKTEALEMNFRQLSAKLENFMLLYQESFQIESALQQGNRIPADHVGKYRERKKFLDQVLKQDIEEMRKMCEEMSRRFHDMVKNIQSCQTLLVNTELANWKQSQQLFNWEDDRGKVELNNMQQWFEGLAGVLWRCRQISKQFELLKTRAPHGIVLVLDQGISFPQILTKLMVSLIQASFVIEKQPPQVIKTSNRFSASVRLLVGSKLQIHLSTQEVVVTIINDKQAKSVFQDVNKQVPTGFGSGEIMNNQKSMEYNTQSGTLSSSFNFMQLRRIKRNLDKKASEMVTEEKFTLLFRTQFSIGGGELEVGVKTCSLPVVVIVHVTQQPPAEATIFWDNAFSEANRELFQVPDSVEWPRLSDALHCFFHANTGRGLTSQNLEYLGRKLLGVGLEEDISRQMVTRQQLCKDQLRGRNFTFWEWFYKHLDLIKTTLKREWVEGSIQGFMQKLEAEKMLLSCMPGTFLIRFSEGDPGGVSVAWMSEGDVMNPHPSVLSLAPWNKHDLSMRSFADRLHDLTHLLIVYPNNPKDKVFGKYYSLPSVEANRDGYIAADLRAQMPCIASGQDLRAPLPCMAGGVPPPSPALSIVSIGMPRSPPWPSLNCNSPAAENDMLSSIDISTFPACNTADLQNMLDGKT